MAKPQIGFEMSVSARGDGTLEAAYIRLRRAKVDHTDEIVPDTLLADYDAHGELIGIEILGPVKLSKLSKLVQRPLRPSFERFVSKAAPEELVVA